MRKGVGATLTVVGGLIALYLSVMLGVIVALIGMLVFAGLVRGRRY
jgi:hypothetical protein